MFPIRLFLFLCCLGRALAISTDAIPLSFEEREAALFVAHSGNTSIRFRPAGVSIDDVTLHFLKADPGVHLEGLGPAAPATYLGAANRRTFQQFPELAMRSLYPGVDAVFYGNAGGLEYDLQPAPGAFPIRLRLWFENARRLRLSSDGSLVADAGSGELRQMPPRVFQAGRQVAAHYVLLGANRVAIRLGK